MKTSEVLADIRARLPNGYSDAQIMVWMDCVIEEVWEDVGFEQESVIALKAAQREYTLPKGAEFGGIMAVSVDGTEYAGKWMPNYAVRNVFYKAADGVIGINPAPAGEREMRIFHVRKPDKVSAAAGETDVRPQFMELVKNGVFCIMAKAMGDVAMANNYAEDYNAALAAARQKKVTYGGAYPVMKERQ